MLKRVRRQHHGLSFGSSLTKPRLITARSPAARLTTAGTVGFGDWHPQVAGVGDRGPEAVRQGDLPTWARDDGGLRRAAQARRRVSVRVRSGTSPMVGGWLAAPDWAHGSRTAGLIRREGRHSYVRRRRGPH